MEQIIRELWQNNIIKSATKIFLLIMVIYLVMIIWKWKNLPAELPLFYSQPRSPDQLGTPALLLLIPLLSLAIFILHFYLACYFYRQEKLISFLLVIAATIIGGILLTTFIKIVFIVS